MIEYSDAAMWRLLFKCRGSVVARSLVIAVPSAIVSLLLTYFNSYKIVADARQAIGMDHPQAPMIWAATTAPLFTLLAFRTSQAWGRFWEGTGLLHAMRGEWFDSASCLATFSLAAKSTKPDDVNHFRHTLTRLMSLCHGSALDELKVQGSENYEVIDIKGLDDETVRILQQCKELDFNRVEVILHMIQVLVIRAQQQGVISIPPPILSRVYQTLSRGFVNLLNAKKIKNTHFPFPYAQLIALMVLGLAVTTPFMMSVLLPRQFWSMVGTFVPVFAALAMNYIAGELEMPFGDDYNDLPLAAFQTDMNSSLLMLIHDFADHVPKLNPDTAYSDFESLQYSLHEKRNSIERLNRSFTFSARASTFFGGRTSNPSSAPVNSIFHAALRPPCGAPKPGTREQRSSQTPTSTTCQDLGALESVVPSIEASNGLALDGTEETEAKPTPLRTTLTQLEPTEGLLSFSTKREEHSATQTQASTLDVDAVTVTENLSPERIKHVISGPFDTGISKHVRSGHNENGEQSRQQSRASNDSAAAGPQTQRPLDDMRHPKLRRPVRQRVLVSTIPDLYPRSVLYDV